MPDVAVPVVSVAQHYATHLAPVYEWLCGGLEAAVARAAAELTGLGLLHRARGQVVDLGAGFGAHSLALARAGHAVLALDTSELLLQRLQQAAHDLPVTTIAADLLEFRHYLTKPADLILCMGDTLTHLSEQRELTQLVAEIAGALNPHGVFIATFRDYSQALSGVQRFIPVKSDAQRILTCFLEFGAQHVIVHDVLHERQDQQWRLRVSAYSKLRLAPAALCAELRAHGLQERQEAGPGGMIRIVASR